MRLWKCHDDASPCHDRSILAWVARAQPQHQPVSSVLIKLPCLHATAMVSVLWRLFIATMLSVPLVLASSYSWTHRQTGKDTMSDYRVLSTRWTAAKAAYSTSETARPTLRSHVLPVIVTGDRSGRCGRRRVARCDPLRYGDTKRRDLHMDPHIWHPLTDMPPHLSAVS